MRSKVSLFLSLLLFVFMNSFSQEQTLIKSIRDEALNHSNDFKINEISILFIGDFMGHMDQINAAYNKELNNYNYNKTFEKINPILSDADISIGNLEVTLGVEPYSGYPRFSSPAEYASAIKTSGVDVLVTANNHSCDKKKLGLEKTISILDSLNIGHTGTFINSDSKKKYPCYLIEKNNMKVAIVNYTYGTNGILPSAPNIVNYLDKSIVADDINYIKDKIRPDQIIAFLHWGDQYKNFPNKAQEDWFNYFTSLGVNIVIGSHPHVLQPIQWFNNSNSAKDELVAYSLGNFLSHQRTFPRDGGAVLKINLIKNESGVNIKSAKYHLTWVHEFMLEGKKHYDVLSVKDYESNPEYFSNRGHFEKLKRFSKHARSLMLEHNIGIEEY